MIKYEGHERRQGMRVRNYLAASAFMIIILLVAVLVERGNNETAEDLEIIARQTCESVNAGRKSSNEQARLTRDFLMLGVSARRADARVSNTVAERNANLKAARQFEELANSYREIELADCTYPPIRDEETD